MANRVITLGREYGSGGRYIAETLAKELGIAFYDKEIIAMVAKESGLALEFIEDTGEYMSVSDQFAGLSGEYYTPGMSIADQVHVLQNNIIASLAEKEPCVIVGRCADYILKDNESVLDVFIHADMKDKVERAVKYYGIPAETVEKTLTKTDKGRATHYKHYTGQTWGIAQNYDLCIDSGFFGVDGCVETIIAAYKTLK